jgi:general secretion pathway protein D
MGQPGFRITALGQRVGVLGMCLLMLASCMHRPFFDEKVKPMPAAAPAPSEMAATTPLGPPQETAPPKPAPVIVPGSDVTVRSPSGAPTRLGGLPTQGEVTLNFVDADLREVLRAVLGDTLGRNYVVDPNVQGTVTLRTSRPIPIASLLSTVEDILALNNAALIDADGMYKVVPADQALRSGGRPRVIRPSGTADIGTGGIVVVPLRHAAADDMARLLQPIAQPNGMVTADPERNVLLLGGSTTQVETMLQLADTFDVDFIAGKSFGLFPIETTDAETMVSNLEEIFGSQEDGPLHGVLRIVPIDRLNSVLVISARRSYLDRAKDWIARLDAGQEDVPQIFVYHAENSRAADLAAVLSNIFPPQEGAGRRSSLAPGLAPTTLRSSRSRTSSSPSQAQPPRSTTSASNDLHVASLMTDGGFGNGLAIGQTQTGIGTSTGGLGTNQQQQQQQQQQPLRSQSRQQGLATLGQQSAETLELGPYGEVRIVADDVRNAVVVYAKPRAYRLIEQALRKLDTVPLQVLIEATILDVELTDDLKYGVEWFFHNGDVSVTSLNNGNLGVPLSGPSPLSGFTFLFKNSNLRVLVSALNNITNVNVVSSPQVFVLDNQTASIQVGDEVPTVTQQQQSTLTTNPAVVNSVQYINTGVILDVTPRVNPGGLVSLDIVQEVSDPVQTTTSNLDTPTIQQRRIESSVAVQNGETVALGGLIRDSRTNGTSGIPFLSRIPVIGALFGAKTDNADRTELLVLITPRVVPNQEQAQRVTDELRQRLRHVIGLEERIQ